MTKMLILASVLAALSLSACQQSETTSPVQGSAAVGQPANPVPQSTGEGAADQPYSRELTVPRDQIDPELLAEYLDAPGMTAEDVEKAKALRAEAEAAPMPGPPQSEQDRQATQRHDDAVNAAYDILLEQKTKAASGLAAE